MRHLIAWRAVVVGLASFCTLSLPCIDVMAQEHEFEHVLIQSIRRGDTTLLKDIMRQARHRMCAAAMEPRH